MAIGDGFRKIDADAVNANQPLDAFALQGVAENLTLARDNRTRRIAVGWPADVRPVMAAHDLVAYPLCMWPVSSYAKEVTIEVRHAVTDAPVHMGLATIYSGRLNKRVEDLTKQKRALLRGKVDSATAAKKVSVINTKIQKTIQLHHKST